MFLLPRRFVNDKTTLTQICFLCGLKLPVTTAKLRRIAKKFKTKILNMIIFKLNEIMKCFGSELLHHYVCDGMCWENNSPSCQYEW